MNRPETTKWLSKLLEEHIDPKNDPRVYWAKEITFDYGSVSPIRVDYMQFKPVNNSVSGVEKGDVYCYEIKSSVEDFRSKNGHNLIGDFNYYVMPTDVYEKVKLEIPYNVGVMCPETLESPFFERTTLVTKKNAKRSDRSRPVSEMLLMMWRSSRREVVKCKREEKKNWPAQT